MAPGRSRCRARCGRVELPSLRRRPRMCESTVRRPEPSRQPQTSASSCSRVNTTPGRAAIVRRRSNSVGVRCFSSPSTVTRRDAGSSSQRPELGRVTDRLRPPLDPPQQRPDPRHQLARRERLGHVVVGADAEPDEHVRLVVARREHQHRHRPVALDPPAHLEPVEARQHQVEDDEIRPRAVAQRDAVAPVVRDLHGEALGPQPRGDRGGDHILVLDHADQRSTHESECARAVWRGRAVPVQVPCRRVSRQMLDPRTIGNGPFGAGPNRAASSG